MLFVQQPLIVAKSDSRYLVFQVHDADCCYMQCQQWQVVQDWHKAHADPRRARRSRFCGTLVKRHLGRHKFAMIPYEVERQTLVARMGSLLRSRMYDACKRYDADSLPVTPAQMAREYLGCSLSCLVEKFEELFEEGMDWSNFGVGGWVIDHILPVSSFDFRRLSHVRKACCHYNLRPCWEAENIRKGAKVPYVVS